MNQAHLSPCELKNALQYIVSRRGEQTADNITDPECIATEEHPNAIGVDYHMYRKPIAAYLVQNAIRFSPSCFYLNKEVSNFYTNLLATGIMSSTVKQWMKKYERFTSQLWLARPTGTAGTFH